MLSSRHRMMRKLDLIKLVWWVPSPASTYGEHDIRQSRCAESSSTWSTCWLKSCSYASRRYPKGPSLIVLIVVLLCCLVGAHHRLMYSMIRSMPDANSARVLSIRYRELFQQKAQFILLLVVIIRHVAVVGSLALFGRSSSVLPRSLPMCSKRCQIVHD